MYGSNLVIGERHQTPMNQPAEQPHNPSLDDHHIRRRRYRKLKIIAAVALLAISAPIALLVVGTLGMTSLVGGLVEPNVNPKSNITRSAVPDPSVKSRAARERAKSRFELAEKQRSRDLKKSLNNVKKIDQNAKKLLAKEAALVAARIVNARFGANLSLAEIKSTVPVKIGGNPAAVNQLLKQAVGNESAKILRSTDKRLAGEAQAVGARVAPIMSQKTSQGAASLQLRLSRQIMDALRAVFKKYGARVAGRTAAKSPIVVLDGPVPVADAGLFIVTVADFYNQGGAARRDLTDTIRGVVFNEYRAALAAKTGATLRTIKKYNQETRQKNCAALRSVYNLHPVDGPEMTVDDLCKA